MIIKIDQTDANLKNKYSIKVNNQLKYYAGTPWLEIKAPFDIQNTRSSVIASKDNIPYFFTNYNVVENVANSLIPLKGIIMGKQKGNIYNIIDKENNICAKFYKLINGFLDTKYVIEYNDLILLCYDKSVGKTRNISIYNNDKQIAEIVKPLTRVNNLDNYYIFLLEQYSNLEIIISFFTIFFDYLNYSESEIVYYKEEVKVRYTYDKNDKYYNKDWIKNNFNEKEVDEIYNQILENEKTTLKSIKSKSKILVLVIGIGWLILLLIAGAALWL